MTTKQEQARAVRRMQDFIENHLMEPITLHQLARRARYSPYYAARIFKECTGKTPFEYIRLRRLSAAALKLQKGESRVIDVALDFVFDSHEGFTRAFARHFGLPPSEVRKGEAVVPLFMPARMRDFYTNRQPGVSVMSDRSHANTVFVQIIERPARVLVFKPGKNAKHYFEYCEEVGEGAWATLQGIEEAIHEPMGVWFPEALRPEGSSEYVQGVEVALDADVEIPQGFETVELPACKMLVFQGEPFDDEDFGEAITSLWKTIDGYQPKNIGYAWALDDAPRFQLEPMGYRGYVEGRPVRSLEA